MARALSAAELAVAEALERIAAHPELNAVITVCADEALARARAGVSGRLAGVPLLVKDLIDTAGIRTTYASAIYRDHVPERSAPAVLALEAEGAIVVAKANADEFAWGTCGQNAHYGDTVNPRAPDRIAGGSSSGNAAALAAELVPPARAAHKTIILSAHALHSTPPAAALLGLVDRAGALGADVTKLVTHASDLGDLRVLLEVTLVARAHGIVTLATGPAGPLSRLFLPAAGSLLTYAHVGRPTAPSGQLPLAELASLLHRLLPQ